MIFIGISISFQINIESIFLKLSPIRLIISILFEGEKRKYFQQTKPAPRRRSWKLINFFRDTMVIITRRSLCLLHPSSWKKVFLPDYFRNENNELRIAWRWELNRRIGGRGWKAKKKKKRRRRVNRISRWKA